MAYRTFPMRVEEWTAILNEQAIVEQEKKEMYNQGLVPVGTWRGAQKLYMAILENAPTPE